MTRNLGGQHDAAVRPSRSASRVTLIASLLLLFYFALVFRNHLKNPFYSSLVGGLNLGIHELGHFLWAPLGEFWAVLGGSLTQCLAPILVMVLFYRQRDYFAIAIGFCWLATNLFSVATYAADGLTQQLDLVSPLGDDPMHDWGYLLGRWQKLSKAREIGGAIRAAAVMSMLTGLIGGARLLYLKGQGQGHGQGQGQG